MKKTLTEDFQDTVLKYHIWNKSILDVLSKIQMSSAKVTRSAIKSVTTCGCIEIEGKKSMVEFDTKSDDTQVKGVLCEECRANVEREIGENLYYMISLCNTLNLNVDKIIQKELQRVKTLGKYNLM